MPYKFKNRGLRWFTGLVNSRGSDDQPNFQPSGADPDLVLMEEVSPVYSITVDDVLFDPTVLPIAISVRAALSVDQRTSSTAKAVPLFDLDAINSYLLSRYGVTNMGLHPLGHIYGASWEMYNPNVLQNGPDFDSPHTPFQNGTWYPAENNVRLLTGNLSTVLRATSKDDARVSGNSQGPRTNSGVLDVPGVFPVGAGVSMSLGWTGIVGNYNNFGLKWAVCTATLGIYPAHGVSLDRSVGAEALNTTIILPPA